MARIGKALLSGARAIETRALAIDPHILTVALGLATLAGVVAWSDGSPANSACARQLGFIIGGNLAILLERWLRRKLGGSRSA